MYSEARIEELIGLSVVEVKGAKGSDELSFVMSDGRTFVMYHDQDCCETVRVEDICGDMSDLIGRPIVQAEEVSGGDPDGWKPDEYQESYTWTFYKLGTVIGCVTIRWLGQSNGYYSERVECKWA